MGVEEWSKPARILQQKGRRYCRVAVGAVIGRNCHGVKFSCSEGCLWVK